MPPMEAHVLADALLPEAASGMPPCASVRIRLYPNTAFGFPYSPATQISEGLAQRYTFQGREAAGVAGAPMYYRNRMYAANLGRFIRRDPVLGGDFLYNSYLYAGGMVTRYVDLFGLMMPRPSKGGTREFAGALSSEMEKDKPKTLARYREYESDYYKQVSGASESYYRIEKELEVVQEELGYAERDYYLVRDKEAKWKAAGTQWTDATAEYTWEHSVKPLQERVDKIKSRLKPLEDAVAKADQAIEIARVSMNRMYAMWAEEQVVRQCKDYAYCSTGTWEVSYGGGEVGGGHRGILGAVGFRKYTATCASDLPASVTGKVEGKTGSLRFGLGFDVPSVPGDVGAGKSTITGKPCMKKGRVEFESGIAVKAKAVLGVEWEHTQEWHSGATNVGKGVVAGGGEVSVKSVWAWSWVTDILQKGKP